MSYVPDDNESCVCSSPICPRPHPGQRRGTPSPPPLNGVSAKKLTFGDLKVGDHFISWPLPGDNSGHGGYLGGHRLFVKVNQRVAHDGRGVDSMCPTSMYVIKILLG